MQLRQWRLTAYWSSSCRPVPRRSMPRSPPTSPRSPTGGARWMGGRSARRPAGARWPSASATVRRADRSRLRRHAVRECGSPRPRRSSASTRGSPWPSRSPCGRTISSARRPLPRSVRGDMTATSTRSAGSVGPSPPNGPPSRPSPLGSGLSSRCRPSSQVGRRCSARRTTPSTRPPTVASPALSFRPHGGHGHDEDLDVHAAILGVTRHYAWRDELLTEVGEARIWGGLHYRTSVEVGLRIGERVVAYNLQRNFRPG